MDDDVRAAVAAIPMLAGYGGPVERLGGLTNRVYRLGSHCLRIPGKGTEEYINRANEAVAAREAARAGVSPDVLYFDAATGLMVTRFIDGAETMSPQKFKARAGAPARAGQAFRKLHDSGAVFPFRFELFAMIDGYLKVLAGKEVALPEGYHDVVREADQSVRAALAAHELPLTACHCDPLCENFLDTGRAHVDRRLGICRDERPALGSWRPVRRGGVRARAGRRDDPTPISAASRKPAERGRIVIYKAMCDLLVDAMGPDPARQQATRPTISGPMPMAALRAARR